MNSCRFLTPGHGVSEEDAPPVCGELLILLENQQFATDWLVTLRVHRTLRCTPAMAAGVTDRLWSLAELRAPGEEYAQLSA